jgi:tetratricopeptide (TPR) repeat protein
MGNSLGGVLESGSAEELLREARGHDLGCRAADAMECYAAVIDLTADGNEPRVRAEALRRLGILHHLRAEPEIARDLCRRSYQLALEVGAEDLGADACNALAGFALERGDFVDAQDRFHHALQLARSNPILVGKIEQNLGIIANIRGEWLEAMEHYARSLTAYEASSDNRGCAIAHHNLGMIHADRKQWTEADRHYQVAQALAEAAGDRHLGAIALMNQAEVRLAEGDYDKAWAGAQQALQVFTEVEARRHKAGAHRLLGMVCRRRGQTALAESHLGAAFEIAASASCPLIQADSAKELAGLYEAEQRTREALDLLLVARELYGELEARADLAEVQERIEVVQRTLNRDGGSKRERKQ